MWMVLVRTPRPDEPSWRGRRELAALDAVAWPLLWIVVVATQLPAHGGLFGAVIVVLSVMVGCARLSTALGATHRYRFTTWRWGCVLVKLLIFGWLLKLVFAWAH